MKVSLVIILCGILAVVTPSNAVEDTIIHPSPDGSLSIKNMGDTAASDHHFQIVNRNGDVLLASDKHPDLESGSFAEGISWSPDSRYVAFSVRTSGPYICDTFVYSTRLNRLLRIQTEDEDYQTRPIRWIDAQTLIIQTNSPFGGKATNHKRDVNQYRRTVQISEPPLRFKTLYSTRSSRP